MERHSETVKYSTSYCLVWIMMIEFAMAGPGVLTVMLCKGVQQSSSASRLTGYLPLRLLIGFPIVSSES